MIEYNKIEEWVSRNNTKKIQYVLLFFIFMMALSNQVFDHLFGCSLKSFTKNIYVRHAISLLFLYLIIDFNLEITEQPTTMNPLLSFMLSIFIYTLALILLHSHQLYIRRLKTSPLYQNVELCLNVLNMIKPIKLYLV